MWLRSKYSLGPTHEKQLAHVVVLLVYETSTKVMLFFFLVRNCNYSYNEIYIYHGYILYKGKIFFARKSPLSTHIFNLCVRRCMLPHKTLC